MSPLRFELCDVFADRALRMSNRLRSGFTWLAIGLAQACAVPMRHAQYAGWDPMPAEIPAVDGSADARLRVAQSRALWWAWREGPLDARETGRVRAWDAPGYTYIRAEQRSKQSVEFTLLVVERDRVVLRALVEAAPDELDQFSYPNIGHGLHSLWLERGSAVGSHTDGAPSHTIEQLYEECERMIGEHPTWKPRLYFHPNGILMHCGFSRDDCSECSAVSIQSLSLYRLDDETPRDDPAHWVCTTAWGAFAPGSQVPEMSGDIACYATQPPVIPKQPSALPAEDICSIDPAACPVCDTDECRRARWAKSRPSICGAWPTRAPSVLEVGKPDPLGVWQFPFSGGSGIECGRGAPRIEMLRIKPSLPTPAHP